MYPTVTLTGNLTADPELRFTGSGVAVASFTVACNDTQHGDKATGEPTFVRCSAWRQMAENVAECLQRGDRVLVTGRWKQREFTTQDGDKRRTDELDVQEMGATLRFTSVRVVRAARDTVISTDPVGDDPWATPRDEEVPF